MLKEGDTIGLIAPGSPFSDKEPYQKAIENIESLGFKVKLGKNLYSKYGYLAGRDEERLADLHTMFADDEVAGIWCIRGGYGTSRLLPGIDYKLIKNNPKALIGFSDITALLQAIYQKTGLVGFHGPVAAFDFTEYTIESFKKVLMSNSLPIIGQSILNDELGQRESSYARKVINPGIMAGQIAGGNLSLIAALSGTNYEWDVKDKILLIEDVGEKPYRVDRMLTQLLQNQDLNKAAGILLGVFNNCEAKEKDASLKLMETLEDRLRQLNIPVAYGFSFGHIENQCTLPIGIKARFDTDKFELQLLEGAVY